MTDIAEKNDEVEDKADLEANGLLRTPEMEMTEIGAGVKEASELDISEINPANPHLFKEDRWQEHFARLRSEDPVHLNELDTAGRYWSVTKYDDVRAVDGDWETYSSASGISLGRQEFTGAIEDKRTGHQQ